MPDLTPAQVHTLARIAVFGARRFDGARVSWVLLDDERTSLRAPSVNALLRADAIEVHPNAGADFWNRDKVELTDVGRDALAAHPQVTADVETRKRIKGEHEPSYAMYSRGRSAIRGGGRISMGCTVKCSCGAFSYRSNMGRADAQDAFEDHLASVLEGASADSAPSNALQQ